MLVTTTSKVFEAALVQYEIPPDWRDGCFQGNRQRDGGFPARAFRGGVAEKRRLYHTFTQR
jgi:hypothetical protein